MHTVTLERVNKFVLVVVVDLAPPEIPAAS